MSGVQTVVALALQAMRASKAYAKLTRTRAYTIDADTIADLLV